MPADHRQLQRLERRPPEPVATGPSYGFDWSTDYCSASPDQPLGFDFRLSCWRHDFGYRNYKAVGAFPANKSRSTTRSTST